MAFLKQQEASSIRFGSMGRHHGPSPQGVSRLERGADDPAALPRFH